MSVGRENRPPAIYNEGKVPAATIHHQLHTVQAAAALVLAGRGDGVGPKGRNKWDTGPSYWEKCLECPRHAAFDHLSYLAKAGGDEQRGEMAKQAPRVRSKQVQKCPLEDKGPCVSWLLWGRAARPHTRSALTSACGVTPEKAKEKAEWPLPPRALSMSWAPHKPT